MFQEIKDSLRQLYLEDQRPWRAGFNGGKDMHTSADGVASLLFDILLSLPDNQRIPLGSSPQN